MAPDEPMRQRAGELVLRAPEGGAPRVSAPLWRDGERVVGELMWPAGELVLEVQLEGRALALSSDRLTGVAREDDALVEVAIARQARQLSAQDEPITALIDPQARTLTLRRVWPDAPPLGDKLAMPATGASVGALLDEALYGLNIGQQPPEAIIAALLEALRSRGAHPIRSSAGWLLLAHGAPGDAPEVRGSFTDWMHDPRYALAPLSGALWGRWVAPIEGYHAYKVVRRQGASWLPDPGNPHIQWDGVPVAGLGSFNAALNPEARPASQGRMVWWPAVYAPQLDDSREVYLHLPPDYDRAPTRRYPTLYVQDGNESIARSQLHEEADAWATARPDEALIMAFIGLPSQAQRMAQYTVGAQDARGERYASFVAQALVPQVDAALRTRAQARWRGVKGASLGGLISYWIATRHPTIFGYVAGMSSSFWWEDQLMVRELARLGCQGLRYYLDSGAPMDNTDSTRAMRAQLEMMNCAFTHVEEAGGQHDWSTWRGRFSLVLRAFFSEQVE